MDTNDYIKLNRDSWNKRTDVHWDSAFYNVEGFLRGESSLTDIEKPLLGDIQGKKLLHLQCHFGQDTLSLARLGAHVTGVDLSDKAIEKATELAQMANLPGRFICSDLFELPHVLDDEFDIVFTSYGTIGWLPDLEKWAHIVHRYLKPGGRFIMADFHPVLWMFDNDFQYLQYRYFKTDPIVESENGTYTDRDAPIVHTSVSWNHGLSEILNNLIRAGMQIDQFLEYDFSPYNCFSGMIEYEPGKFRIETLGNKIPMVYAIEASRKQLVRSA